MGQGTATAEPLRSTRAFRAEVNGLTWSGGNVVDSSTGISIYRNSYNNNSDDPLITTLLFIRQNFFHSLVGEDQLNLKPHRRQRQVVTVRRLTSACRIRYRISR